MKQKCRRRSFPVVNLSLQFRFLAISLAYGGLTVVVLGAALFLPDFLSLYNETLDLNAKVMASEVIFNIHHRLWIPLIFLLTAGGAYFFLIFHRIAGPLSRFRWAFGRIAKGDLSVTAQIRQNDFLHLEESALNAMINSLSTKLGSVRQASDAALTSLDQLEMLLAPSLEKGVGPRIHRDLEEHRQALEAVREKMRAFKQERLSTNAFGAE
jgi:methyl-accepting chemotaxis protein